MVDHSQRRPSLGRVERRVRHTVLIALAAMALMLGIHAASHAQSTGVSWSLATAYTGSAAIALTLVMGPATAILRRPAKVSTDLRRDIGLAGAILTGTHIVLALNNHFGGRIRDYFIDHGRPRRGSFGWGVWSGVVATLVLVVLMATSNDLSMRRLGRRWKRLQRVNYGLGAFTLIHAAYFWSATRRSRGYVVVSLAVSIVVFTIRVVGVAPGFRRTRGKDRRVRGARA
jgi:sulfoxide reductase heme-binding subunit YedZ